MHHLSQVASSLLPTSDRANEVSIQTNKSQISSSKIDHELIELKTEQFDIALRGSL